MDAPVRESADRALVLTWWVGAYALVFGVALIVLAFRLRRHRGERIPGAVAAPI